MINVCIDFPSFAETTGSKILAKLSEISRKRERSYVYIETATLVSVVSGSIIPSEQTFENAPCFVNEEEIPATIELLQESIRNIYVRLNDLKFKVETRLEEMVEKYGINLSENEMETARFIDYSNMNATINRHLFIDDFCNDTTSFLEKIREHYDRLNELAYYFEILSKTALDTPSLESLTSIQSNYIYGVMCSIKTALRSGGQDPATDVPSGNLSATFIEYRQGTLNRDKKLMSEYVSMLDSRRLSTYLYDLYISFSTPVFEC